MLIIFLSEQCVGYQNIMEYPSKIIATVRLVCCAEFGVMQTEFAVIINNFYYRKSHHYLG